MAYAGVCTQMLIWFLDRNWLFTLT